MRSERAGLGARRQAGAIYGKVYVIMTLIGIGVLAAKIIPVYINESYVQLVMERVINHPSAGTYAKNQLIDRVEENFAIENIAHLQPKDIKVKGRGEGRKMSYAYEVRVPMYKNLEAVMSFEGEYQVGKQ